MPEEAVAHHVLIASDSSAAIRGVGFDGKPQERWSGMVLTLTGAPQYVAVPGDLALASVHSLPNPVAPQAHPAAAADPIAMEGAVNLKLFEAGTSWKFLPNTGQGSFVLAMDGDKPIGVLNYDFTQSRSQSTPYVLAAVPVRIEKGATTLVIHARSAIRQRLTFRVVDSTGQTHQYKGSITGTGGWEAVRIPLNRRLEHWGGAADGQIHFPIEQFVISVPLPGEDHKAGKVEFSDALLIMGAATDGQL
jgi:hypothetical protein